MHGSQPVPPSVRAPLAAIDHHRPVRVIGLVTLSLLALHVTLAWSVLVIGVMQEQMPGLVSWVGEVQSGLASASQVGRWVGTLTFFGWSYEAASRAYALGRPGMTVSRAAFVLWYVVPFANLFMPYVAIRQLATACDPEGRGTAPVSVLLWWLLYLASTLGMMVVRLAGFGDLSSFALQQALSTAALVALFATMQFIHRGQAFWAKEPRPSPPSYFRLAP